MPVFSFYIKTSQLESRGTIVAASQAAADTAVKAEYMKTYKTGATAQTTVTPTLTTITLKVL